MLLLAIPESDLRPSIHLQSPATIDPMTECIVADIALDMNKNKRNTRNVERVSRQTAGKRKSGVKEGDENQA